MNEKKMKRLSDEYTGYSGSAKAVSERIRNAGKETDEKESQKSGSKKQEPGDEQTADMEALRDGAPGSEGEDGKGEGDPNPAGEEVVEPPAPGKLSEGELAQDPQELLEEIDGDGDEDGEATADDGRPLDDVTGGESADKEESDEQEASGEPTGKEEPSDEQGTDGQDRAEDKPGDKEAPGGDEEEDSDEKIKKDMKAEG